MIPFGLLGHPAVFAVEEDYQIMMLTERPVLVSITIGDKVYYNDACGVRRSDVKVQRIIVPQAALDTAKEYTLRVCEAIERKPYWPTIGEEHAYTYAFRPLTKTTDIHLYHIADAHGRAEDAIASAKAAVERPDVLLFNGDIPNHCGNFDEMNTLLLVASEVGQGVIPCVNARGNHDYRGTYAEHYVDYMPTANGNSYYTFRLGCLWGVVLDCGEDKPDEFDVYGGTICCHAFRERETEFLRHVKGYDAPDVKYRLVLCHNPFTYTLPEPFNIEIPLFTEWANILRETVKPQLMICGHTHTTEVCEEGGRLDHKGQPCPIIIASNSKLINSPLPNDQFDGHTGATITLRGDTADVVCNDSAGTIGMTATVPLKQW